MTKIAMPFNDIDQVADSRDLPHKKLLTPDYINNLAGSLAHKFPGAKIQQMQSGVIILDAPHCHVSIGIVPMISLTFDVRIDGDVNDRPFVVTAPVFPDDDPAILADWIYTEVARRMKR